MGMIGIARALRGILSSGGVEMKASGGSVQERKRSVAEQLWLHYYNQKLYDRGVITAEERDRMTNRINARGRSDGARARRREECR